MILLTASHTDSMIFLGLIILFIIVVCPLIIHFEFKQSDKREAEYKDEINKQDLYDRWG